MELLRTSQTIPAHATDLRHSTLKSTRKDPTSSLRIFGTLFKILNLKTSEDHPSHLSPSVPYRHRPPRISFDLPGSEDSTRYALCGVREQDGFDDGFDTGSVPYISSIYLFHVFLFGGRRRKRAFHFQVTESECIRLN